MDPEEHGWSDPRVAGLSRVRTGCLNASLYVFVFGECC